MTLIIIACGARKAPTTTAAADLYTGPLFRAARRAAEARTQESGTWLILSARHGLIRPEDRIAPYEQTIRTRTDVHQLAQLIASQPDPGPAECWAPARYRAALEEAGRSITAAPLTGLSIGRQLQWFTRTATNPNH